MFGLGMPELFLIFLVVFLLFGAKNIPEIARGFGQALRIFKKEAKALEDEINKPEVDVKKDDDIKPDNSSKA